MKKTIFLYLQFIIILNIAYSQQTDSKPNETFTSEYAILKLLPQLTDDEKLILFISDLKGDYCSFKYKYELINNQYRVEAVNGGYCLRIFNVNGDLADIINLKKHFLSRSNVSDNKASESILYIEEPEKYFTDNNVAIGKIMKGTIGIAPLLLRNNIFLDKDILQNLISGSQTRIINKTITLQNAYYINNNAPAYMFDYISDATIIPDNSGNYCRVFLTDSYLDKIQYFSPEYIPSNGEAFYRRYGTTGTGLAEFKSPSGITFGDYQIGNNRNIYVAEFINKRIQHLTYKFENNNHYWGSVGILRNFNNGVYDVTFNRGKNYFDQSDDVLWVSEENYRGTIHCLKASDGSDVINPFDYFNVNGTNFPLGLGRVDVYTDYVNGVAWRSILAYVSQGKREVFLSHLNNENYLPSGSPPNAFAKISIPGNQYPMSAKLITDAPGTSEPIGLIIISNDENDNGYIHRYKILFNPANNYAVPIGVEYLGSTPTAYKKISSTDYSYSQNFVNLVNLESQVNYSDIYTIERWNDNYGIRRLKTGVDIQSSSFNGEYCRNSGINLNIKLTNPVKAYIQGFYQPPSGSYIQKAVYLNGIQTSTFALLAGSNNLNIKINTSFVNKKLEKSGMEMVRFIIRLIPIDETDFFGTNNASVIEKYSGISECNSGGCPFLYVYDGNDFMQDNNIMHRSELPDNVGKDINDLYKLSVYPKVDSSDSSIRMDLRELNNDYSYFDRVQLFAVDHPIGTICGITENNDIVLYYPQNISSPSDATCNSENVTNVLQYDSLSFERLNGNDNDIINGSYRENKKSILFSVIDMFRGNKNKPIYENREKHIYDSLAVIIDPAISDWNIYPSVKNHYAASIIGISTTDAYHTPPINFARRQNKSAVIVPLSETVHNIDSLVVNWNGDYSISYLGISNIFYTGFIKNELPLLQATDYKSGNDVSQSLLEKDNIYAEMDTLNGISLMFDGSIGVPSGYQRDFVLSVDGRYKTNFSKEKLNFIKNNPASIINYQLFQNYPNPFNPVTKIKFAIPKSSFVKIRIYDILGKELETLINENFQEGIYETTWNASRYSSGIYFYRLQANGFTDIKKMILLK